MKKNIRDIITERIAEVTNTKELKFTKAQIEAIAAALLPQRNGGNSHDKVNEAGLVYCNYFNEYLPSDKFKKTPQDKWPPMSIDGTKLRQKSLTLDKQMNKEISEAFLSGTEINKADLIKKYDDLKSKISLIDETEDKPARA